MDQYGEAIEKALNEGFASLEVPEGSRSKLERELRCRIGLVTSTELTLKAIDEAKPNTLSAKFGLGEFPHHTDFAFRSLPPRLIVLINDTDSAFDTPTMVSRFDDWPGRASEVHARSQWLLKTKGSAYVVGGITNIGDHVVRRWDTTFLEPENGAAWFCVQKIGKLISSSESVHEWLPRTALLIDNWNCTHSRGFVRDELAGKRRLCRLEAWYHAGLDC